MQANTVRKASEEIWMQRPVMTMRNTVDTLVLSGDVADATGLLDAASRLVEMIAFDVACSIEGKDVVSLLSLSAQLEAEAVKLRNDFL